MKRIFLILILNLTLVTRAQITVPETTKSLYGIVEATWCGNCGHYGIPSTAEIIDQTEPKAIYISMHRSGSSELYSQTANQLATAFGVSGQPIFTLNGNISGPYSGTIVNTIVSDINSFYDATSASVNAGFEYTIVGDSLYTFTRTTFFEDLTGEYYMAVYVIEDSIWEWQTNYDPGIADMDIWHNHVLRTSMNGHFGQQISDGFAAAGTDIHRNAKIKLDPEWNTNHIKLFTTIWKKNGTEFEFINSNDEGSIFTGYASVQSETEKYDLTILPNPAIGSIQLGSVPLEEISEINIYNLSGKQILSHDNANDILIDELYNSP